MSAIVDTLDFIAAVEARKARLATIGVQPVALVIGWGTWDAFVKHAALSNKDMLCPPTVKMSPMGSRTYLGDLPVVIDNLCKPGEFWIAV